MAERELSITMTAQGWRLASDARARTRPPRVLTSGTTPTADLTPAVVLCWDDFAPAFERDALYERICASATSYAPSSVAKGAAEREIDEAHRKSMVNVDDPWIRARMLPSLEAPIEAARRFYGIERIPLGRFEIQVTASGAGDFFALHCDDATPEYFARMLTFVYYLHSRPRRFAGGELRVFDSRRKDGVYAAAPTHASIEPLDNRLIVFPSDRYHEVTRVDGATPTFGDRRITVNGWAWAQDGALPPATRVPGGATQG